MIDRVRRDSSAHVAVVSVDTPEVDDETGHHLRVLRLRPGSVVTVTDGAGHWRECRMESAGRIDPVGEIMFEPPPRRFRILCAIPKQQRPELIVQKVTELGVMGLEWIDCEHSVVRWDAERAERQLDRHRRIAVEAALQSRRVWFPSIDGVRPAAEVLPMVVAADPEGAPWTASLDAVAIGPEGGWSSGERALAAGAVSLGPHVLRVETAAIAAAALALVVGS